MYKNSLPITFGPQNRLFPLYLSLQIELRINTLQEVTTLWNLPAYQVLALNSNKYKSSLPNIFLKSSKFKKPYVFIVSI